MPPDVVYDARMRLRTALAVALHDAMAVVPRNLLVGEYDRAGRLAAKVATVPDGPDIELPDEPLSALDRILADDD
jgi:hypothetical protein